MDDNKTVDVLAEELVTCLKQLRTAEAVVEACVSAVEIAGRNMWVARCRANNALSALQIRADVE